MVATLKAAQQESSTKITILEEKLSSARKQLQEAEGVIVGLRSTNEELNTHASHLTTKVLKA